MNEIHIYLLKVSLGLAIISVPYYFLFRNDPNLVLKRFYLLAGLLVSWIFPLIVFRRPEVLLNFTPTVFIDPSATESLPVGITTSESSIGITINWIRVAVMVYLSGLAFMLIKNLWIILRWNLSWHKNRDENGIAFTGSDQVFTIFTRIFVPGSLKNEQDLDNILLHEKAHVQQLHFIDLTLMELTLLLTWFNPFSWLISRMIKENHEHMADRRVLSAGVNPARYRAQLLNHTLGVNVFRLGNQFNHSLTLKRFKMMKKPEKSPLGIIKIALLIPAVLIAMGLTTGMTPQQQKTIKGKVILADCGEAAVGAAVVIANSTTGTVVDLDGTFMLNVDGDPELVISFVGYGTLRVKASEVGKKPLKLEVQPYTVDLEDVPAGNIRYEANSVTIDASDGSGKKPVINQDGEEEVFYVVEDMPMFPGGRTALKAYIDSNLEYPPELKAKGISGEVNVQFLVKGSGKLEDITVASSSHKEFEAPALAVFKNMPDWNPGKQRGKPVKVRVVMPIRFTAGTK